MLARRAPPRLSRCGSASPGHGCSCVLLWVLLDDLLEGRKRLIPEPVELGAQRGHAVRVRPVDAAVAVTPVEHEPGLLQYLQVLRDRRSCDGQLARDVADGTRAQRDAL